MSVENRKRLAGILPWLRRSISIRILLILLIWVLPLNLIAIVLGNIAVKNVEEKARTSVAYIMNNYMEETGQQLAETDYLIYSMLRSNSDAIVMDQQEGGYDYEISKNRFYKSFRNMFTIANVSDGSFYYLAEQDDLLIWDKNLRNISRTTIEQYIREEMTDSDRTGWFLSETPQTLLWHVNRNAGACYGGMVSLNGAGQKMQRELPYTIERVTFTLQPEESTPDELTVSGYWERPGVWMNVSIRRQDVSGSIEDMSALLRYTVIAALFFLPFFYMIIYKLVVIPLKTINKAHEALEKGNPDYRITKKARTQEYERAFLSFNTMADRIRKLKIENYEKEISRKQTELKNLQLQIRPHFLLNMFNLIYNLSRANDAEHIRQVILYLSDYFLYIFRNDKELELFGKEQRVIEGYIRISQLRYPGCIEADYEYDPEIMLIRVPPLLIHNFVENIIKHVVKQGRLTNITIIGQYDSGTVTFLIIDDGDGMEEEAARAVSQNMHRADLDGKQVGMSNAYRRLRAFYGDGADIGFESEPGIGTTVTVTFPYDLEEDDNECSDCK
ncbi:MAG: histidine kinase [Roseburia sp.]|nr:histidine kinase [Roseburia sp.]